MIIQNKEIIEKQLGDKQVKVLLIEDNSDNFSQYEEDLSESFGFSVYPEYSDLKVKLDYLGEGKIEKLDFYDYLIDIILSKEINFIIFDLNLSDIDASQSPADQTGIYLMNRLYKEMSVALNSIPSMILTKSHDNIIQQAPITSNVLHFAEKANITSDENGLSEYFIENNLLTIIAFHIKKYYEYNKLYSPQLNKKTLIENKEILYKALKDEQVIPYYQPIINKNKEVIKYEVLARVINNNSADTIFYYLNAAKTFGLLFKITEIIIKKTLASLQKEESVSINVTYTDLVTNFDKLFSLIQDEKYSHLEPSSITFEILEDSLQDEKLITNLKKLKSIGYKIAIDDFGINHSNLLRYKKLINENIIDYLKIDGEFIKNLKQYTKPDHIDYIIIDAIRTLVKNSDIEIIAEYVTHDNISLLRKLNVNYFQGYDFGEPKKDKRNQ